MPIPGTTDPAHSDENLGGLGIRFSQEELVGFIAAVAAIIIDGERLRKELLVMSGREAPARE